VSAKKRKRLGEAVFESIGKSFTGAESLKEVKLELIEPPQWQPRKKFEKEKLETLKNSIKQHGLLQPMVVEEILGNRFRIISGERRFRACNELGIEFVPVRIISNLDNSERIQIQIAENLDREDITPVERAKAVLRLFETQIEKSLNEIIIILTTYHRDKERLKKENPDIAPTVGAILKKLGKSENTIIRWLKLLQLPESLQELLDDPNGIFTPKHAGEILKLGDIKKQERLAKAVWAQNWSAEKTKEIVSKISNKPIQSKSKIRIFFDFTKKWLKQAEQVEFKEYKKENIDEYSKSLDTIAAKIKKLRDDLNKHNEEWEKLKKTYKKN